MTVTVNLGPLDHLDSARTHDVEGLLADNVRADADPFVPYLSGNLARDSVNVIDTGAHHQIVYDAPYANYVFDPKHRLNYTKKDHPLAGPDWIAQAKDQHMNDWERLVGEMLLK